MGAAYNSEAKRLAFNEKMRNRYRMKVGIPLDAPRQRAGRKQGSTNKKLDLICREMGPLKYYWQ